MKINMETMMHNVANLLDSLKGHNYIERGLAQEAAADIRAALSAMQKGGDADAPATGKRDAKKAGQTYSVVATVEDHHGRPLAALRLSSGYDRHFADKQARKHRDHARVGVYWDCVKSMHYQVVKRRFVAPAALRTRYDVIPD